MRALTAMVELRGSTEQQVRQDNTDQSDRAEDERPEPRAPLALRGCNAEFALQCNRGVGLPHLLEQGNRGLHFLCGVIMCAKLAQQARQLPPCTGCGSNIADRLE